MILNKKAVIIRFVMLGALLIFCLLLIYFYAVRPKKDFKIIFITKTIDSSIAFWNNVNLGMQTAAKEYGVSLIVDGPENEDQIDIQNQCILNAIAQKPDLIILAAANYTSQLDLCRKIVDSGIMLMTLDSDINSEMTTCFVGTNNFEAGKYAGEAMTKIISEKDQIVLISFVEGSAPAIDREKGVLEGLGEAYRDNVIGTYFCNANEDEAYEIMNNILKQAPENLGVICLNEYATSGAARAIKANAKNSDVKMVGIDSSFIAIKALEDGTIDTLVVQKPFNMGYLGIINAISALNGDKVDRFVDTGAQIITKDTMYSKENQKLLFIFADMP